MIHKMDHEVLKEAEEAMLPQRMKLNQSDLEKYLIKLKFDAKKDEDKLILFFVFGESHGFIKEATRR